MREKIGQLVKDAANQLGAVGDFHVEITYPDSKFGDYATNAALVLAKSLKQKPQAVAVALIEKIDKTIFENVEVAGPGFINFKLKTEALSSQPSTLNPQRSGKILLEYFQPNIAKPLHIGHLETAVIGDAIKRMLIFAGEKVESDTHMGDWGTQFGFLILAVKKFGKVDEKIYAQLNQDAEQDPSIHETAKQEFVKLEQGDGENRKIWQALVEESVQQFLQINQLMDILPFDHHWPESFYEDKMPAVLTDLTSKGILKVGERGAKIVDLESQNLGVAVIVKSDGGTTYLLRDLATFIFAKQQGFGKHLYVVDNRQSHHYKQMFAILKLMGVTDEKDRSAHIEYGFMSFKGEALSTRKGNMILALDVIAQAEEKVAQIIAEKNPDLKDKPSVIKAVTKGALKYFILKHNRRSDIEFSWDEVLDFEGNSGPYLQYAHARLSSILRKAGNPKSEILNPKLITPTERELLFKLSILPEIVEDALSDYLPNTLANYLYELAGLINKFYHESHILSETDENLKSFRLDLIAKAKTTLGQGLELLGIQPLEEM